MISCQQKSIHHFFSDFIHFSFIFEQVYLFILINLYNIPNDATSVTKRLVKNFL